MQIEEFGGLVGSGSCPDPHLYALESARSRPPAASAVLSRRHSGLEAVYSEYTRTTRSERRKGPSDGSLRGHWAESIWIKVGQCTAQVFKTVRTGLCIHSFLRSFADVCILPCLCVVVYPHFSHALDPI